MATASVTWNSSAAYGIGSPGCTRRAYHFYLAHCVRDALADNRLEAVAPFTRDLAARAEVDIDTFNRTVDALAYHGQLGVLVEAFRIAWPDVKSSSNIVPWGVSSFMNTGADYEVFYYLENNSSPDPRDPILLDRMKFFVKDPRGEYLSEFISDLAGKKREKSGKQTTSHCGFGRKSATSGTTTRMSTKMTTRRRPTCHD